MRHLDWRYLKSFWDIAKLYWISNEKWSGYSFLVLILSLLAIYTPIGVELNTQQGHLISALSSQDAERFWAFARVFMTKPDYVILGEATSALDLRNEEHLYRHLVGTHTTFISVGHRPTLKAYHALLLELFEGETWTLQTLGNR